MFDPTNSDGSNQTTREHSTLPDLFAARISVTRESYTELLQKFALDLGCRPHVDGNSDGTGTLVAYVSEERMREIQSAGYSVEMGENVSALGRERQAEVGTGDRFEGGRIAPKGLGQKRGHGHEGGAAQ
jgi:hypothetical protein